MNSYKTVRQDGISEYTEKKSRFISYVYPVSAESDQSLKNCEKSIMTQLMLFLHTK